MKIITKNDLRNWIYISTIVIFCFFVFGSNMSLEKVGSGYWVGSHYLIAPSLAGVAYMTGIFSFNLLSHLFEKEDERAFLIQRPISLSSIFWSKAALPYLFVAGSALMVYFFYVSWRIIPGHFPAPNHPENHMINIIFLSMSLGSYFLGIACACLSQKHGGWPIGILALSGICFSFSNLPIEVKPFSDGISLVAIFDIFSMITAYSLFLVQGDISRLRPASKIAIGFFVIFCVLQTVDFARYQSFRGYEIQAGVNRLIPVHVASAGATLDSNSPDAGKRVDFIPNLEIIKFSDRTHLNLFNTRLLDLSLGCGVLAKDKKTAYYFDQIDRVYKGYSTNTLLQTAVIDGDGIHSASTPGGLNAAHLGQQNLLFSEPNYLGNGDYICTPRHLIFADLANNAVIPIFKATAGEKIIGFHADPISSDDTSKSAKPRIGFVLTNKRFIALDLDHPKTIRFSYAPNISTARIESAVVLDKNKGYCLWLSNGRKNSRTALMIDQSGKIVQQTDTPIKIYDNIDIAGPLSEATPFIGIALPNIVSAWLTFSPTIDHQESQTSQILILSLIASIAAVLGTLLVGFRLRWGPLNIALGITAAFLFGLVYLLFILAFTEFPSLGECENCGKKRIITRLACEHCGAPWTIALTGTEIFETPEMQKAAFASVKTKEKKPKKHTSALELHMKSPKIGSPFKTLLWKECRVVLPWAQIMLLAQIVLVAQQTFAVYSSENIGFSLLFISCPVIGVLLGYRLISQNNEGDSWNNLILRPLSLPQIYLADLLVEGAAFVISAVIPVAIGITAANLCGIGTLDLRANFMQDGQIAMLLGAIGLFTTSSSLMALSFVPYVYYYFIIVKAPSLPIVIAASIVCFICAIISSWAAVIETTENKVRTTLPIISKAINIVHATVLTALVVGSGASMISGIWLKTQDSFAVWQLSYRDPSWIMSNRNGSMIKNPIRPSESIRVISKDLRSVFLTPSGWTQSFKRHLSHTADPETFAISDSLACSAAVVLFDSFVAPIKSIYDGDNIDLRDELIVLAPMALLFGFLSAVFTGFLTKRQKLEKKQRIKYVLLSVFLGLYAPLFILFMHGLPELDACPKCGKERLISEDLCEHCGAEWPKPSPTGAEIFEEIQEEARK